MSLLARAARSSAWTFAGSQSTAFLTLGMSVVVARMLAPAELGRYAIVAGIVAIVTAGASLQAGGYYVVAKEATPRLLRTGLLLEFTIGAALFTLLTTAAVGYGAVSKDWSLCGYLVVAGAVLLTNPFGSLSAAFTRKLEYRTPTIAQVACFAASVSLKIGLVLAGLGIWGLVVGDLALSLGFAIVMLIVVPIGRGFARDRQLARKQLAFGVPSLATGLLGMSSLRVQDFVVAAMLGTRQLGFFYLASRLASQAYQLGRSLSISLLPAFSRADERQLAKGFTLTVRLSAFLVALPLALIVALATPLVVIVYGRSWQPAAFPLTLLCAAVAIRFVLWHVGNLLKSRGRVREMTKLTALQGALTAAACAVGAAVGGIVGVAVGVLAVEFLLVPPKIRLIRSVVPFRLAETLRSPLIAMFVGIAIALLGAALLSSGEALVVSTGLVTVLFGWALWRSDPRSISLLLAAFRRTPREN